MPVDISTKTGKIMRKRTHEQECIFCKSSEYTKISNSKRKQFYCKKCKKYFTVGSTRRKNSFKKSMLFNMLNNLFYAGLFTSNNMKSFLSSIKSKDAERFSDAKIKFQAPERQKNPDEDTHINVNGKIRNSIIITESKEGYVVTKGLDVRQVIHFEDYTIHIASDGPMKGDFHSKEDFYENRFYSKNLARKYNFKSKYTTR